MVPTTINDLIGRIAERAKQLADEPINMLRRSYPEATETDTELVRYCIQSRFSRGDIIEAILVEEFAEESNFILEKP